MKRHEKPYGCTFAPCVKKFGSKSDWKRHENSQHASDEYWLCESQMVWFPHKRCVHMMDSVAEYHTHLLLLHSLPETEIRIKLETCRRGQRKFWCGFCRVLVCFKGDRLKDRQNERFDHIDHHFIKEERKMEMWMPDYLQDRPSLKPLPALYSETYNWSSEMWALWAQCE